MTQVRRQVLIDLVLGLTRGIRMVEDGPREVEITPEVGLVEAGTPLPHHDDLGGLGRGLHLAPDAPVLLPAALARGRTGGHGAVAGVHHVSPPALPLAATTRLSVMDDRGGGFVGRI